MDTYLYDIYPCYDEVIFGFFFEKRSYLEA